MSSKLGKVVLTVLLLAGFGAALYFALRGQKAEQEQKRRSRGDRLGHRAERPDRPRRRALLRRSAGQAHPRREAPAGGGDADRQPRDGGPRRARRDARLHLPLRRGRRQPDRRRRAPRRRSRSPSRRRSSRRWSSPAGSRWRRSWSPTAWPSRSATSTFGVDIAKLTETMLARKRWKDLKGAEAYDVSRGVLVSTTDVRRSNSAAMYLALTSYAKNGDVVTDRGAAEPLARQLAELFKRQGYQENYVNGNFDDYVAIGMGKAPMAFIYEYQLVSHALAKKGIAADMVLMYPQPTIVNKVVFMADQRALAGARRPARQQRRAAEDRRRVRLSDRRHQDLHGGGEADRPGGRGAGDPGRRPAVVRHHGRHDRRGDAGDGEMTTTTQPRSLPAAARRRARRRRRAGAGRLRQERARAGRRRQAPPPPAAEAQAVLGARHHRPARTRRRSSRWSRRPPA